MSIAAALVLIGALVALFGLSLYLWAALGEEPGERILAKYAGIVGGAVMVLGIFMAVGW